MVVNIKFFVKETDEILEPTNAAWVSRILSLMLLVAAALWRRCIFLSVTYVLTILQTRADWPRHVLNLIYTDGIISWFGILYFTRRIVI